MKWSWKIGEVAGIGIFVHWTFLLLIGWVLASHLATGEDLRVALEGVVFVITLFGCVVLHELGHALTAKRFDIRTRDITLLPIGGLARLERIPEKPYQELLVALAGPAVNVVIAAVLFGIVELRDGLASTADLQKAGGHFADKLLWVNVLLVAFNLLPAFPMDGGRVLRALLAMKLEYVRATEIAANVGQAMAIAFVVAGVFYNWFLAFIGIFVYLGAQEEARMAQMRSAFRGVPVRQAMLTRFRTLAVDDTVDDAVEQLLAGSQQDFPVVENGQAAGVLLRSDLMQALAREGRQARIGEIMRRDCGAVEEGDMLETTFQRMREQSCPCLPVVRGDEIVGVVTLENVGEWIMIQSAARAATARGHVDDVFGRSDA